MAKSDPMDVFVNNIGKALNHANLEWKDLSKLSGIDPSSISRIKRGREGCTFARGSQLANAIGYELYELLDPHFQPKSKRIATPETAVA